ncbi:UNVERIFIED_CONTAM: hypothetical protein GTU68_003737 [Idotea baltica]|nr:hypothetical protein [Idotea baltica]
MNAPFQIDLELIKKYDGNLPRYTSYPTALNFNTGFNEDHYRHHAAKSNQVLLPKPLSIYVHIPFCHSLCYFCGCNKVVTRPDSAKVDAYLDALMIEIRERATLFDKDRLVQQIHFGGGTPNFLTTQQLSEVLEEIAQCFHLDFPSRLEVGIELDPRHISSAGVKELSSIGFNRFSIGVQDFSKTVQLAVNRVQCSRATLNVIETACNIANSVNVDLITGLPNQSVESVKQTTKMIVDSGVSRVAAYGFAYMPDRIKAQKLICSSQVPLGPERIKLSQTVSSVLQGNGYHHIGMDHYTLEQDSLYQALQNNSLQRNFQGYTTHAQTDLIGLGVSAISSFDTAFSQNTVSVSDYLKKVRQQSLPIIKGLSITPDDQLRQKLIQQIMCHGKVDLTVTADTLVDELGCIPLNKYFSNELKSLDQFETDQILNRTETGFELTDQGRYFMRPVAALFDASLNASKSYSENIAQFSRTI